MSQFNKLTAPLLNYNQKINTITVASDIGLNNIFSIYDANFEDLRRLTNNTIAGGGLSDQNISNLGISNVSTNLYTDVWIQGGDIAMNVLINGAGNFAPTQILINGSLTTPVANKKVTIFSSVEWVVTDSAVSSQVAVETRIEVSVSPTFSSILASKNIRKVVLSAANNIWTYDAISDVLLVTVPTQTVLYFRVLGLMSGNESAQIIFKAGSRALTQMN